MGSNYILKDNDVVHLVKCLTLISDMWEKLGLALDLPKHVIEECRCHRNILSFHGILMKWVKGHGLQPASLGRLVEALAGPIIGHGQLASNLISDFQILFEETLPSSPEYSYSNKVTARSDPPKFKCIDRIPAFTVTSSSRKSMPPCLNS